MVLFYYSLIATIISTGVSFYLLLNFRTIKQLGRQNNIAHEPAIAVIIPVRNEEQDVEQALESVCRLNYKNYRVMVVNDRSTDSTPAVLQRVKSRHPQIEILTIKELPTGWLGKTNALYQGYKHTGEEWLLFTDADIVYHPDALSKAINYAVDNRLDYLTILPHLQSRSELLNSVYATFSMMLMALMRPWAAKNPKSKSSAGVGAFILLKRTAYEKAGTHDRIRMCPVDDAVLGKSVKLSGLRMDVLSGLNYISLEWYKNLREMEQGLLKNTFSITRYNVALAMGNVLFILLLVALPIPLMLVFGTLTIRLMALLIIMITISYMIAVPRNKWWYAFMTPFSGFFIAYIVTKATIITVKQGGIYWRGSFYSLAELKKEGRY